jgi:hypothetical protein
VRVPRLLSAAIVAGVLGLGATPAHADIFVAPFLGVKFRGSTNQLDLDTKNGVRATKSSVGVSGIVVADKGLGFELDVAHQSRFFEQNGSTLIVTRSGVTTLSGNVMLAAPLSFTRDSLRPYVVVGLGWMHATANDQIQLNPVNNDYFALTTGLGAIGFLTDVVGLRFDLRRIRSLSSADTSTLNKDIAQLRFWRATLGVVFR